MANGHQGEEEDSDQLHCQTSEDRVAATVSRLTKGLYLTETPAVEKEEWRQLPMANNSNAWGDRSRLKGQTDRWTPGSADLCRLPRAYDGTGLGDTP